MVIVLTRHPARTSASDLERLTVAWTASTHDGGVSRANGEPAGIPETVAPGFWERVARAVGHGIGVPEAGHLGRDLLAL